VSLVWLVWVRLVSMRFVLGEVGLDEGGLDQVLVE